MAVALLSLLISCIPKVIKSGKAIPLPKPPIIWVIYNMIKLLLKGTAIQLSADIINPNITVDFIPILSLNKVPLREDAKIIGSIVRVLSSPSSKLLAPKSFAIIGVKQNTVAYVKI